MTEAARQPTPLLTDWRLYLETLEESLPGKNKLILDRRSKGRRHLLFGLPKDLNAATPLWGSTLGDPELHE